MARISGVDLPRDKRVLIGLTYIFGIGRATSQQILDATGIDVATRLCRHPIREVVLKVVQPRRVNGYPIAGAAPEHLGNWSSRDLASDVPESHVERAEGVHARA